MTSEISQFSDRLELFGHRLDSLLIAELLRQLLWRCLHWKLGYDVGYFLCWSAIKICLIIMLAITITCWRRGWHPKQIFGLTLRKLFFLKVKNITDIEIAILIKNESQMLVTLKMLKHMITCGMAGEEAEQMESSRGQLHFQGFWRLPWFLVASFFQFELLRSITSCVQTPLID